MATLSKQDKRLLVRLRTAHDTMQRAEQMASKPDGNAYPCVMYGQACQTCSMVSVFADSERLSRFADRMFDHFNEQHAPIFTRYHK